MHPMLRTRVGSGLKVWPLMVISPCLMHGLAQFPWQHSLSHQNWKWYKWPQKFTWNLTFWTWGWLLSSLVFSPKIKFINNKFHQVNVSVTLCGMPLLTTYNAVEWFNLNVPLCPVYNQATTFLAHISGPWRSVSYLEDKSWVKYHLKFI